MNISITSLNFKQKKQYIKRHVDNDILDLETLQNIYKVIRDNNEIVAIRNIKGQDTKGICVDLNKLSESVVDNICGIIHRRLESIIMN